MAEARVVRQVPRQHHCGPNDFGYWMDRMHDPARTVVECECGRTWVSRGEIYANVFAAVWRPEGRFERWRRERKS